MHVLAYAPFGAEGIIIRVEADIRRGIPGIDITGLAEGAVREARERVRAGFRNSGFSFPQDRILINLAPAGLRKEGAALDLPIAISVMAAAGIVPVPDDLLVLGEMELSGRVRPVLGTLAAITEGLKAGIREYIVPLENAGEAAVISGVRFFAAATLAEAVHALKVRAATGELPENNTPGPSGNDFTERHEEHLFCGDFSEVHGQGRYKRVMEIAAAGGHNVLVFGPPGAGKTMLARRFPSLMPLLEPEEAVEVTRLHSLAGEIKTGANFSCSLMFNAPFRSPHHSSSAEGILGGGRTVKPGEITLAHFGTLFLDEAPQFRSPVLQSLREPLEDRVITIVRAEASVKLPAEFQLILAANSCPCGRLGAALPGIDAECSICFCSADEIQRHWRKLGSSLLDRIEMRVPVSSAGIPVSGSSGEESSEVIRRRVTAAIEIQKERFKAAGIRRNARMSPGQIKSFCPLNSRAAEAFNIAAGRLGLSGRACYGILKTARTIADLEGKDTIEAVQVLEAVQHRRFGEDPYDILEVNKQ